MPQISQAAIDAAHRGSRFFAWYAARSAEVEQAGVGRMAPDLVDDVLRDGADVERIGAAGGDRSECRGEFRDS